MLIMCIFLFLAVVSSTSDACDLSLLSMGQRFMTDLLVSSLMADGGLETSLDASFKEEIQVL